MGPIARPLRRALKSGRCGVGNVDGDLVQWRFSSSFMILSCSLRVLGGHHG